MKNLTVTAIVFAIGFTFLVGAIAEDMSKQQYDSHEKNLRAKYRGSKVQCNSLSGNVYDICVAEAKGERSIDQAELEASYKPNARTQYNSRVTKSDAEYAIARERCEILSGASKTICRADAKARRNEREDTERIAEIYDDPTPERRDAEYSADREKCETLKGTSKGACRADAKVRLYERGDSAKATDAAETPVDHSAAKD